MSNKVNDNETDSEETRAALLRDYVTRLSRGDSLEEVRKDFVSHFKSVDASEIVKAEQNLISGGVPLTAVQKLCDVHSALFHGATQEEKIANAEKAVQESAASFSGTSGHPVNIFDAENAVISGLISEIRECMTDSSDQDAVSEKLDKLQAVSVHYSEKGDLLYPLLKSKYGVSGPADVMWAVDDEIRTEIRSLLEAGSKLPHYLERLDRLLMRVQEMIYKEKNILMPLCIQHFTEEEWMRIYYELSFYDDTLSGKRPAWRGAEGRRGKLKSACAENPIPLGSGHMTPEQIESVLNTIPMELTFIDDNNINCFFNAGKKIFKRPDEAIGREVFFCHPPKYAAMARQIIDELKSGAKDSVDIWMTKGGRPLLVRYMAVRNAEGKYVGTLECVQKMQFAAKYFAEPAGKL